MKNIFVRFFPYILAFSYSLFAPYDSDMGWHLKYGEYFFRNGRVLRENIYSSMLAGYQWINSSWATDLLTYLTFRFSGFLGISILGAFVVTAIFYFFSKAAKLNFWEKTILFPVILYLELPFIEVSFRGQMLTLLSFGILYYLFSLYTSGRKKIAFLFIPLFMLWSNFHGQFILGLGIFLLMMFLYLLQKYHYAQNKKEKESIWNEAKILGIVSVLSIVSTIINPFGANIYLESLRHFGNPLQKYIIEWLPFDRFSLLWWNHMFWEILIFISLGIILFRKNFFRQIHLIVPVIILLLLSVSVRRYTWVLLLISIPVVRVTVSAIKPKTSEISATLSVLIILFFYGFIVFNKLPRENIANLGWDRFCDMTGCSNPAALFLQNYKYEGNLMTFYNWGGWLIWKYPTVKTSIDGRMHLWRDASGYSAFLDYYPYEQNKKDIDNSPYDLVFMSPVKPVYRRLETLVANGKWKIVYNDSRAGIFERVKGKN